MNIIILDYCTSRVMNFSIQDKKELKKIDEKGIDEYLEQLSKEYHFRVKDCSWMCTTENIEVEEFVK